ncbi:MAG TPA: phospho-N-acetylmuramoyl-pentapeptide-transferase [Clostridiales bacterium]|nr:phospho-N-acetylmuramoyl-pentapeptide-transferase [Clostridiales bacterium]
MNKYALIFLAASIAFFVTACLGFVVVPIMKRLKAGQTILKEGPESHKIKEGTPTMGGIMFIIGVTVAVIVSLATARSGGLNIIAGDLPEPTFMKTSFWSGIFMALAFGLVGFADDLIIVKKKRGEGLSVMQKTFLQLVVIFSYLASIYLGMNGKPYMHIPFVGNVEMGFFFWIFGAVVFYAATNAVNFTDGVDGLCSSVTITVAVSLLTIALMRKMFGVGLMAAALAGGCGGFLVWNRNPAKIFMGDTGSLFLGGMILAMAYSLNTPLLLLPIGIVYVAEGASVAMQRGYYKLTGGKRIFKMSPIHHHFELSGWGEKKIVIVFTAVSLVGCILGILIEYLDLMSSASIGV